MKPLLCTDKNTTEKLYCAWTIKKNIDQLVKTSQKQKQSAEFNLDQYDYLFDKKQISAHIILNSDLEQLYFFYYVFWWLYECTGCLPFDLVRY